ncbi:hypothetical protein Bca101_062684 [Brassica carinata]
MTIIDEVLTAAPIINLHEDMIPTPAVAAEKNETFGGDSKLITSRHVLDDEKNEFWKQPNGFSKDLPSDLQKLRCKVAFEAPKFSPRVMEMGKKLAERTRSKGPYIALHLRLEKDVWVRTGCLTGISSKYDEIARIEGIKRPKLLTAKSSITPNERKLAGLCPLNAKEVTRLLRELGAPRDASAYSNKSIPR